MINGILLINKPAGMTSHDVVSCVRKKLDMKRVGHAGTLDPLATGVLVILLGKSTKMFEKFQGMDKEYAATLMLGTRTRSADIQGEVLEEKDYRQINQERVEEAFKQFVGETEQLPPMVSAVKLNGRRLYELARKGIEVERKARSIRIDELRMIDFESPYVRFLLSCSKGTYVRQLADDVGNVLDCGACITQIERTKVGPFSIDEAISIDEISEGHVRNGAAVLLTQLRRP